MRLTTTILLFAILCISFIFCACDCGDDDDNDDAHDNDDDDDTGSEDDDIDDDADDDTGDDDADDDTGDDDEPVDQYLTVPAALDDGNEKYAVVMTQWIEDEKSRAAISLIASPGGEVRRTGEAKQLGDAGTGWVSVEDFTGDGVAEIAVSWITLNLDGTSSAEVVLLDAQSLETSRTLGLYQNAQAFLGPHADVNGDGIPELIVRVRPIDDAGGQLHAFDGAHDYQDLWNLTADPNTNIDLYGPAVRSAWIGPGDYSGLKGDEFLIALYDRSGDAPQLRLNAIDANGQQTSGAGPFALSRAGAFSIATADMDRDGDPEIAVSFQGTGQTTVYVIRDNFEPPDRDFIYPAGAGAQLSLSYDLDNDQLPDLVASVNPADDAPIIDVYLSGESHTTAASFETTGDRIDLIGAVNEYGLRAPGEFGNLGAVFGVSRESYEEGGPAFVEMYSAPRQGAAVAFDSLAGDFEHLRLSCVLRDFNGDDLAELFTVSMHYLILDAVNYYHRIAVFTDAGPTLAYDTDFISGAAVRGGTWDFDEDGIPEAQIIHYGSSGGDAGWIRLINGKSDWSQAVMEFTAAPDADAFLFGLIR